MKLKMQLFSPGLCKNLLKRCWPLWCSYFAVLLFCCPLLLSGVAASEGEYAEILLASGLISCTKSMVFISAAMGILTAMVMFSYMYNARSCGMIAALPVSREATYITVFCTGLAPMLLADLLTALFTVQLLPPSLSHYGYVGTWLLFAVLSNVAFYGFAVFCAQLTGNLAVLPAVYAVLNFAAYAAECCIRKLLGVIVYGMSVENDHFLWLSPVMEMSRRIDFSGVGSGTVGPVEQHNIWIIYLYAAVGILFAVAGLFLYRVRRMETAGDTVALSILRPVFRYCMTFGCAVAFSACIYKYVFNNSFRGLAAAALVLALLLVGAFIGWYASQMLIRKTLKVFHGSWKGLAVSALVLVAFVAAFEFDVFGYERYVPPVDNLESVTLETISYHGWDYSELTSPENVDATLALHRSIIADRALDESAKARVYLRIVYKLKDGSRIYRMYYLSGDVPAVDDPASTVHLCNKLINTPEAIIKRNLAQTPESPYSISYASVEGSFGDTYLSERLPPEQAYELYSQCIVPELKSGKLVKVFLIADEESQKELTSISFYMEFRNPEGSDGSYSYFNLQLSPQAVLTLEWLKANVSLPSEAYLPQA